MSDKIVKKHSQKQPKRHHSGNRDNSPIRKFDCFNGSVAKEQIKFNRRAKRELAKLCENPCYEIIYRLVEKCRQLANMIFASEERLQWSLLRQLKQFDALKKVHWANPKYSEASSYSSNLIAVFAQPSESIVANLENLHHRGDVMLESHMQEEKTLRQYDDAMPFPNLRVFCTGALEQRLPFSLVLKDMYNPLSYGLGMLLLSRAHKIVIAKALYSDRIAGPNCHCKMVKLHYPFPLATAKIERSGFRPRLFDNYYRFRLLAKGLAVMVECMRSTSEATCEHFLLLEGPYDGNNFLTHEGQCKFEKWPESHRPKLEVISNNICVGTRNPENYAYFGFVDEQMKVYKMPVD